jgi:flagellin
MSLTLNTNVASLNAQRQLEKSQSMLTSSLEKLSSGSRINSAKDDAAGLGISTSMTSQIHGETKAKQNANDAISLSQTADGTLSSIADALQRMRELAVQAANGTNSSADRANLETEFDALQSQISSYTQATYNGVKMFDATASSGVSFQVGSTTASTSTITVCATDLSGASGISASYSSTTTISAASGATAALTAIDAALTTITSLRATFGASQSRFESVISNLSTSIENTSSARSRITDVDYSSETANMTKANILQQAGTAMLSQANSLPQSILSLLK